MIDDIIDALPEEAPAADDDDDGFDEEILELTGDKK